MSWLAWRATSRLIKRPASGRFFRLDSLRRLLESGSNFLKAFAPVGGRSRTLISQSELPLGYPISSIFGSDVRNNKKWMI